MPELPDAEVFKQYFDATALHKPVSGVTVADERVLDAVSPQQLGQALSDRSFQRVHRHGKYLFAEIESGERLVFHFGMTGSLKYYEADDATPEHARVRFDFADGGHLAFVNPRLFGRIALTGDAERFLHDHEIGPDALALSRDEFHAIVGAGTAMAKSILMDQAKLSGIGNIYSDEILFQARIHPRERGSRLSAGRLDRLFDCMHEILEKAIEKRADPAQMPENWLIAHRREGAACPMCGAAIETLEIGSRTGYYCPSHQSRAKPA
ncbi:MAG: hypothetical protein KGY53_12560 [Wenzhouxiangellaceae bacterium]|nr:hypothetical protein [Wenzhouxiangellaceae bacterium]